MMEDTKKKLAHIRCPPVNKEADILDQLQCCDIYFQHIANNTSVTGNLSQFYENVQVLIGILLKLPSELKWCTSEIIQYISISLIQTVAACCLPLDGQMMCSAGLCSALNVVLNAKEKETLYNSCLNTDGCIFPDLDWSFPPIIVKNLEVFRVCLCHGILQSNEASGVLMKGFVDGSPLIYVMLNILEEACMKYSRLTSVAFKVLVSWVKKVCLELKLNMTSGVLRRIFSIVNSNWENPIKGVKEQNIKLFDLFLDVCSANKMNLYYDDDTTFGSESSLLHCTMEGQPWKMKSKYCILNVLLPRYGVRKAFVDFPDLASGLVSSLSYSHLVSTGSGVYKSCLKDMDADDWTTVFMTLIVEVLTGRDVISVEKQNAFNYWIPSTLKKFPLLLNCLLDQLIDTSQSSGLENAIFSIISLLKLGQKGGLLFNTWDEKFLVSSFKYLDFLNLMNSAICHSCEAVRSEAFAVVCMSSKPSIIPSLREVEMVRMFLLENVSSDSASLRREIVKSFALFLTRICDSSIHALEVEQSTQNSKQSKEVDVSGISQNIQFLNWVHNFLISNLEPGTNYQRRILSLQLYLLILSYFSEPPGLTKKGCALRKKGMTLEGKKVMEYAVTLGQWLFISESSYKTILSCILDPTDDIREVAGLILMEHFSFYKSDTEGHKRLVDHALQLCTSPLFYETESGALLMKVIGNWTYKMPIRERIELLCSMTRTYCNKNLTRNRNHSSILMLYNQQKLLDGLKNKPTRNICNKVESRGCTEVEMIFKDPWEDGEQNVKPDDWNLSKSSKSKSGSKSESNIGTSGCRLPTKNTKQLEPENVAGTYSGSAPLSVVLLTQAEAQLTSLKADLAQAASSGSPLHGTLSALIQLATQSDSPECGLMSAEEVNRTVMLLEQTASFFLQLLAAKSVSTADVAPSFAEMDEAIQSSIRQSLSDLMSVDEEELQLSPAHQLVLNCVWLNLKACCTLASGLVCNAECSVEDVKRCGILITQVLTRCRHKGAIEAAGVALSTFVKSVTSQTAECNLLSDEDIQLTLGNFLTEFLDSLVCGGKAVSVTRRSAGLSILIHKMLASDMRTGKPLLHMCMSQLLEIARSSLDFGVSSETKSVLVDLPQTQALHFLKVLVQDSSLKEDIAQYISQVTIICFSNFSSTVWTVRNAALQLSGALISKLAGQKKIQDEEMTSGGGVSVEELFSHFPELNQFMLVLLQKAANCHPSQALEHHADLIPMLSLLATVAVGTEIFISASLVDTIAQYRVYFLQLISSPIYHVRKLAAKAYERFTPFSSTYQSIISLVNKLQMHNAVCDGGQFSCLSLGENDLNGILLTLNCLMKKLKHDNENMPKLEYKLSEIITVLKEHVNSCMMWDSYTYFNRALLLEIIEDNFSTAETVYISADETFKRILDVHKTLKKENHRTSFKPGLLLWAAKVIDVVLKKCCPRYLVSAWYNSYMLCGHYSDVMKLAFVSLKWRLLHDKQIDVAVKALLFSALLKVCLDITEECHVLFSLLDIMLVLIQETKLNVFITFKELQKISVWSLTPRRSKSEYSKVALPVVAGLLSLYFAHRQCLELENELLEFVLKLANCIRDRTDVLKFEEDFRLSAAMAVHLMAPSLRSMLVASLQESSTAVREEITEILLDAELTLLQDEDRDVRIEAARFVSVCTAEINQSLMMNPYSSLTKLVRPDILLNLLTISQAMKFLWNRLCFFPYELYDTQGQHCENSRENGRITSPFDHGTYNIYSEGTKVIDMLGMSLLDIIKVASEEKRSDLRKLVINTMVNFEGDAELVFSLLKRIESCGICSVSSGGETCYIVAKKLFYQSKVMETLRIEGNHDIECVMVKLEQFLKFGAN